MGEIIRKITKGEFSKKLTVWILIVYSLLVFAMVGLMAFINPELGGSFIGILGVIVPIPITAVGFYFNKAKAENLMKIGGSIVESNNQTPLV